MIRLKSGAWILVADGEKAWFLENIGDERNYNFSVVRKEEQDNPANSEQGTDAPGRFNEGPSVQRSALKTIDWHQLNKVRFAAELSELLYLRAHAGRFQEIALVAPPQILGVLRQELHSEVTEKVVAEIPKTLTNVPVDEIEKHVENALRE